MEEVGDDTEAPLEEGLAARGGRGDVPKARFQEFVRFLIHGELERNARSEQAAGEPGHRLRKAQHAEFVGIAPETLPVQRRILADKQDPVKHQAPCQAFSPPFTTSYNLSIPSIILFTSASFLGILAQLEPLMRWSQVWSISCTQSPW